MSSSISRRVLLWLSAPLALLVLVGALGDYYLNAIEELRRSEQRLNWTLQSLTAQVQTASNVLPLASRDWYLARSDSQAIRYVIRDVRGQVIVGDARLPMVDVGQIKSPLRRMMTIDNVYLQTLTQHLNTHTGPVTITVAEPAETLSSMIRFGLLSKLLWDFFLLDVMLLVAWLGSKAAVQPLRQLRDQIAGRSPQDLQPIAESSAPQELVPLVSTLNRLFALVRSSIDAQQHLVTQTAHQLRTPITGINAQLELLIDDPVAIPVRARLVLMQQGLRQLTHATNQLLTMARADAASHHLPMHNRPLDLQAFVSQLVAQFVDRAVAAQIDLGVEVEPAWINADSSLLNDLLSNLIDNALKYTASGGMITVRAGITNGHPFVEVDDNGRGIPSIDYQRVRQRYYRAANSSSDGSGLGLAIVDEITRLYRGTLRFMPGSTGRGACIRVLFAADLLAAQ